MLGSKAVARGVVVTGCSSGFGELIAKTLAASGYRVFATMRDVQSRNAPAARELRDWAAEREAQLEVLELDVTSGTSVEQTISEVVRRASSVDVLVNNAGIAATGPLEAFSMAQVETLFGVNALGPLRVSNAVLPTMRMQGSGLIGIGGVSALRRGAVWHRRGDPGARLISDASCSERNARRTARDRASIRCRFSAPAAWSADRTRSTRAAQPARRRRRSQEIDRNGTERTTAPHRRRPRLYGGRCRVQQHVRTGTGPPGRSTAAA